MSEVQPQLFLLSPRLSDAEAFRPRLAEACAGGRVAAVLLRAGGADERSLVNLLKVLVPVAQASGAAVLVDLPESPDAVAIAVRGGADGLHAGADADWRGLRERLKDGRSLGAGGLRTRDDAMRAGEAGADYVMFGEPRPDGWTPPLADVADRAAWWAEIFETPCVAFASGLDAVPTLAATKAEFIALGSAVWDHPDGPAAALAIAARASREREPAT